MDLNQAWWKAREVSLLQENERLVLQYELQRAKENAALQWQMRCREEELDHFYMAREATLLQEIDRYRQQEAETKQELHACQAALTHAHEDCEALNARVNQLESVERNLERLKRRNAAVSLRDAQDVKDLERMEKEMIRGEKMGYGVKWTKESLKRSTSTAKYDINGRRIRLSSKK